MMSIFFPIMIVILSGAVNGSFAVPMKYMPLWKTENIWLNFSFWGFLLLPWLSVIFVDHHILSLFFSIPSKPFWLMLLGGVMFGLGQICFTFALRMLGLGLAFVINIGLGTAGSALVPILLWYPHKLKTPYGYAIILGVLVFLFGVIMGAAAGRARDKAKKYKGSQELASKGLVVVGVVLGICAGIGSMFQAVSYTYLNPIISELMMQNYKVSSFVAYNITWVGIFTGAFIPYMIYFLYVNIKNATLPNMFNSNTKKYWLYTLIMGCFFWMSLLLFSEASKMIGGDLAPVVAWPMLMIFIILTSNFWGWYLKEWKRCGIIAARRIWMSITALILAVFVFAYANYLTTMS